MEENVYESDTIGSRRIRLVPQKYGKKEVRWLDESGKTNEKRGNGVVFQLDERVFRKL